MFSYIFRLTGTSRHLERHVKGVTMKSRILILIAATMVVFAAFAFSPARQAQERRTIETSVAYIQEGAPVQLLSATHSLEFLFNKAEVKNISARAVRSVTFGVLLSEPGKTDFILASKQEVPTDIKPDAVRVVDVLDLSPKDAEQKAIQFRSPRIVAGFGILGVRFDDGTIWSFDPLKNGGFAQGREGGHTRLLNCPQPPDFLPGTIISLAPFTAFAQTGYTCMGTTTREICTNHVDFCENRLCTHQQILDGSCPNQHCVLQ
jgi:hypothetical protein